MNTKTKNLLRKILIILCLIVALISGYKLFNELYSSQKTISDNKKLISQVVTKNKDSNQITDMNIDFKKLSDINKDIVGWVNIPDTSISYPMVQKPNDNDYYLHRAFDGKSIEYGSIFIDGANNPEFNDNITFVFGHNIDTTATLGQELYFTTLDEYANEEFMKKHPNVQIFTKGGQKFDYKVIGTSMELANTKLYKTKFKSEQEYLDYLKVIENKFKLKENTLNKDNKLIVLCTCSSPIPNDPNRRLVFAYK